ncbi:Ras-related protein RABB1b [Ceratocystis fimbriata CBS 114723]|uniref:Ras-related protein RABB1b n=1 Tax=Ceratocystis fimbriata CBS 114723 TaxID=1035309 RepID=A0A2C5X893_9PEZI|nr:Ras-related protein RABB1b [Ceratocystis fimbriata CBS 114723]
MASAPTWDYIAKLVCIGDSGCGKSSLTIRLCEGRFSAHHDVTIGVEFGSRIVPVGPPHSDTYAPPSLAQGSQDNTTSSSPLSSSATTSPPASTATGLPPPPRKPKTNSKDARELPSQQKHMKLSLWDTAGQETYKSVTRSYFRGASGALLVFDLTRKQTFDHVTDWLADLRQIAEPDIVVVLVGNKADLTVEEGGNGNGKREVTRAEAEAWARANDILEYVETSAKSGENVESAFMHVAEQIHMNIQAGKYDLNDRRSGVKGHASATGQRLAITADQAVKRGCC